MEVSRNYDGEQFQHLARQIGRLLLPQEPDSTAKL
jgi:hypothetical protein